MRRLYSVLFYLAVPLILLRLWWRARKSPAYNLRWRERFALEDIPAEWQHGLWVHAVSVGEVLASVPLVKAIHQQYPNLPVVMTTMTPTGSARVKANFADSVFHVYVPYDIPGVINRFLNKVKPKAVMILETELWPNILYQCKTRNIPVMMANARLSEKSYLGYGKFAKATKDMLSAITILATHAKADAERFIKLGMDANHVTVTGSIKFEIKVTASILEQADVLRGQLGSNRLIWIAGSTHEGEDEQVLEAHKTVLKEFPNALLVLTPRHPERFNDVHELAKKAGFTVARRGAGDICTAETQVYLGDTMGELMLFFAAVDLTFIGGSLVNNGGHNLLEPASLGVASLTGPSIFNFADITKMMLNAKAVRMVDNSYALAQQVIDLFHHSTARAEMGERGRQVIEQNKGALGAHVSLLEDLDLSD